MIKLQIKIIQIEHQEHVIHILYMYLTWQKYYM